MDRDERVSQEELQHLIEDLRRLRQRMAEELQRRDAGADASETILTTKEVIP